MEKVIIILNLLHLVHLRFSHKTFKYDFRTGTTKSSNQYAKFIRYNVLIGCFNSRRIKLVLKSVTTVERERDKLGNLDEQLGKGKDSSQRQRQIEAVNQGLMCHQD